MKDLIGKKFKRNKYGLSIWTKTIGFVEVYYSRKEIDGLAVYFPEICIRAEEDRPVEDIVLWYNYSLDEIVIIDL